MNETLELKVSTQTIVVYTDRSVAVLRSGPVGPPGLTVGGSSPAQVDAKIQQHNDNTDVHENVRSGRDFSALFLNRLV